MIPIHLEWRRPVDGVELVDDKDAGEEGLFRAKSDRFEPISFRGHDLENPLCLQLINCRDVAAIQTFISRFGLPEDKRMNGCCFAGLVSSLKDDLEDLLGLSVAPSPMKRVTLANKMLKYTSLYPSFEFSEAAGVHALVVRPGSLADFMVMEASFALQAGAVMTSCAHCKKSYLTGPLTHRRSHSVYCSDRCRVAAMRVRNAAKGGA